MNDQNDINYGKIYRPLHRLGLQKDLRAGGQQGEGKGADECETNLERWIYTLKNMTTLEDIPFLADNPVFRHLADVADISALSQKDRQKYDESIKTMRDHISAYETAINKGRREGLAEGRAEERITMAYSMKAKGFSPELIAEITGLSSEEIALL